MNRDEFMKAAREVAREILNGKENRIMNLVQRAWAEGKRNAEVETLRSAIEEALNKRDEPRVLTAEEMEQAGKNGDAVYVETPDDGCFWALAYPGEEPPKDKPFNYPGGVRFNAMEVNGDVYDGDFYGMTLPDGRVHHLAWRCWTAPPTDELREATPWG